MFHIVAVNLYGNAVATETIELPYENSDATTLPLLQM